MSGPRRLLHVNRRGRLVRVFDPAIPGALIGLAVLEGGNGLFQLQDPSQCGVECSRNGAPILRIVGDELRERVKSRSVGVAQQTCNLLL